MGKKKTDTSHKVVATNRKALFDYHVEETIEAGLVLVGTEVKALREGRLNLRDSYASITNGKAVLHNCHIGSYSHGNQMNHEPLRPRTLLLHKKEMERLMGKVFSPQRGAPAGSVKLHSCSRTACTLRACKTKEGVTLRDLANDWWPCQRKGASMRTWVWGGEKTDPRLRGGMLF